MDSIRFRRWRDVEIFLCFGFGLNEGAHRGFKDSATYFCTPSNLFNFRLTHHTCGQSKSEYESFQTFCVSQERERERASSECSRDRFSRFEQRLTQESMPLFTSKVTPAHQEQSQKQIEDHRHDEERKKRTAKVYVMLLQILLKRYGGRRHPKIDPFDVLMNEKLLTELTFVPRGSVILYISHQWIGIHHPDLRGDQFYHLLLL